jgi:hypothetical protein
MHYGKYARMEAVRETGIFKSCNILHLSFIGLSRGLQLSFFPDKQRLTVVIRGVHL